MEQLLLDKRYHGVALTEDYKLDDIIKTPMLEKIEIVHRWASRVGMTSGEITLVVGEECAYDIQLSCMTEKGRVYDLWAYGTLEDVWKNLKEWQDAVIVVNRLLTPVGQKKGRML